MNLAWPNRLTLLRLGLIPVLWWALVTPGTVARWASLFLFSLAAVTDVLDGYIARRYGPITTFGKIFDPLADKVLVSAVFLAYISRQVLPAWWFLAVLFREFAVSGLRTVAAANAVVLAADAGGKLKTLLQLVGLFALLLADVPAVAEAAYWVGTFAWWVLYASVWVALLSGVGYFWRTRDLWWREGEEKA
ncbi:MAG: CDP-diacylglycerol--glycerol-3-phosphate 3-phosphatidyltransferase [Brockia lithotrophica]|uniref:CDP-diacylglycerol--glycerol-3-phosphate 3-phosphatidyltransferase n=1 Tax=Brockia lithotrophica TaxID=933949 RepID=A0A2T5G8N4_9BACL|nr:CDP-diacylglycerol--glycerol-3-phosphate 3-phosphatidyltransferase [Brockia lithotrophica]PTQ52551.1 MAG: CDP-diacylglycerol--glycerol-3-phosphate 3-phosphatidyltransferase [Brockia lithotrophica]